MELFSVGKYTMAIDPHDSIISKRIARGEKYKAKEIAFLKTVVSEGAVVVELGAHIGYLTMHLSDMVGNAGRVFAFEPDGDNYTLLQQNVTINSRSNVTVINCATWDETGNGFIYKHSSNTGDHRLYNPDGDRVKANVRRVALDDYFEDYDKNINFIHMCVQGSDEKTLEGMTALLERNPHVHLFICVLYDGFADGKKGLYLFLSGLEKRGFRLNYFNKQAGRVARSTIDNLVRIFEKTNPSKPRQVSIYCER